MICKICGKCVVNSGYYEIWTLACPAHIKGLICEECWNKKLTVRIIKFFKLWKEKRCGKKTNKTTKIQ